MLRALVSVWMRFRQLVAFVVLGVVYFCLLSPLALFWRAFSRVAGRTRTNGWTAHAPINAQQSDGVLALIAFLRTRKRYWLLPVVLVFIVMSILLVVSESVALAPFIYTLF